jgi:hypothetical protein
MLSCAQYDSDCHHTNPKRQRGFRLLWPRWRFGLVWRVRHANVNRYRIESLETGVISK